MRIFRRLGLLVAAVLSAGWLGKTVAQQTPALPPERSDYLLAQFEQNGFTREEAQALLSDPRLKLYPPVAVQPRQIDWDLVIANLTAPQSVLQGAEFAARYEAALARAESQFGVDRHLLVALLRLESNLGKNTGNYVAVNVFYTLLSQQQEERRWRFAADNLAALAAYCRALQKDCFDVKSSYGGALGAAQFLPFSINQFGVDGNGDGILNPFDMEDAILSAANFLVQHGWAPADTQAQTQALAKYYGTSVGYPRAVFAYAEALRSAAPPAEAAASPTQ